MRSAVFDATILVSAFLTNQGVSAELLTHAVSGAFDIYVSDAILNETREVLLHRAHLRKRFVYTDQDVEEGFVASFHLPDFPLSSALDNEVVEER